MKTQWTVRSRILGLYVIAAFVVLLIPIAYTFLFSFNETTRTNITWNGFTIENWLTVCEQPEVCVAFGNSILVGVQWFVGGAFDTLHRAASVVLDRVVNAAHHRAVLPCFYGLAQQGAAMHAKHVAVCHIHELDQLHGGDSRVFCVEFFKQPLGNRQRLSLVHIQPLRTPL